MMSQNFEFLRAKRAVLSDLGGFAEKYAHSDPASSLIKQRSFVEHVVTTIFEVYRLRPPFSDNLNDLMNAEPFRQSVPEVVQNKLHAVRKAGNHAAHPRRPITSQLSLECLHQLFDVAQWFYLQVEHGSRADCPTYAAPTPEAVSNGKAREALEKLRLAEAKYESVLAALDAERTKRLEAERAAEEHEAAFGALKEEGQAVASILQFNEETTRRRLIDQMLVEAGWDVGPVGKGTDEVRQEVQLAGMPTASGVRSLSVVHVRASENISRMAATYVGSPEFQRRSPGVVGKLLRRIGEWDSSGEADLLSYLLFDGEFAMQLIDLGRRDARAHHDALCEFFTRAV